MLSDQQIVKKDDNFIANIYIKIRQLFKSLILKSNRLNSQYNHEFRDQNTAQYNATSIKILSSKKIIWTSFLIKNIHFNCT